MKRQHPDNPELFWCPKCETYKVRGEFRKSNNKKKSPHGIQGYCRFCQTKQVREYEKKNPQAVRKTRAKTFQKHKAELLSAKKAYRAKNKTNETILSRRLKHKQVTELRDCYIAEKLKRAGVAVASETIELKRQHIIMKRTLRQFKEWRKEYESNNADVQREQRENEEADGRQGHTQP